MKKLPGFWPLSSDKPLKLSWTFTKPIPLSLGLCHLLSLDVSTHSNNSERIHSKKKKSSKKIIIILLNLCSIVHSSFSPNSDFSNSSPSDSKSITSVHLISLSKATAILSSTSHLLTISDTRVSTKHTIWTWNK